MCFKRFAVLRIDIKSYIAFKEFLSIGGVIEPTPNVVGNGMEWIAPARNVGKTNIHHHEGVGVLACVVAMKGGGFDPAHQVLDRLSLKIEGL